MTNKFRAFKSRGWASLVISAAAATLLLLQFPVPGQALPSYSLRYQVPCATCHTVAPRLNTTGLAFQANYFNWAAKASLPPAKGFRGLPVAAIATASAEHSQTDSSTSTDFRALELYPSDGFKVGSRSGGYFVDLFAVTKGPNARVGNLEDAYVAVPIAGRQGQLALLAGQATPLLFQYDPVNSLTDALPGAFSNGEEIGGGLSLTEAIPTVRLDYFDRRGTGTADGNYVSVGLPFVGTLALNNSAHVGSTHGVIAQVFRRVGQTSGGLAAYTNGGDSVFSLIGTHALLDQRLLLTAALSQGHSNSNHETERRLTFETEYDWVSALALTGRLEATDRGKGYPVLGLTYYPFRQSVFRLSAETTQQPGNRSGALFTRIQF